MNNIKNMHLAHISTFDNVHTTKPTDLKTLYSICTSTANKDVVEILRTLPKGSEEYDKFKRSLPCFTPSMECTQRGREYMTKHSGFVCIDWDNIADPEAFKRYLQNFSFISFAAQSCSGKGVYAMVAIDKPTLHTQHYEALLEFFEKLGYPADVKCKDVARLRFVSYDPSPYYNDDATVWRGVKLPPQPLFAPIQHSATDTIERTIYAVRNYVTAYGIDITVGRSIWLAIGNMIHATLGITGKSIFRDISQFHPKYNATECDKIYDNFGAKPFRPDIGLLANACRRSGVPDLKDLLR